MSERRRQDTFPGAACSATAWKERSRTSRSRRASATVVRRGAGSGCSSWS